MYKRERPTTVIDDKHQARLEKFGPIYLDILIILWEHDPIGISSDLYLDEYSLEADTIIPRLKEASSEAELCTIVYQEFRHWFGSSARSKVRYFGIAHDIWAILEAAKLDQTNAD